MNDGYIELNLYNNPMPISKLGSLWEKCLEGGTQFYEPLDEGMARGKHIKLTAKGIDGKPYQPGSKQAVMIDGEVMEFEKFMVMECVPGGVEFLFDYEQYFKDFGLLKD